jgi:enoyl-CoA hydratase/carnithine racemase
MPYPRILYAVTDGVAVITFNDPPASTYSYEMMRELDDAVLEARMDASVHVIVLTGQGEKFFCAGANIRMLKDADPTFTCYFCLHANETLARREQTPKLAIGALGVLPGTDGLALERELQQRRFESADAQEGIRASLEKRTPVFTGA